MTVVLHYLIRMSEEGGTVTIDSPIVGELAWHGPALLAAREFARGLPHGRVAIDMPPYRGSGERHIEIVCPPKD